MKPSSTLAWVAAGVVLVIGLGSDVDAEADAGGGSSTSTAAGGAIPPSYKVLYQQTAGRCPGMDWETLAAVGKVETDHGRSPLAGVSAGTNSAGAGGPMQFLAPTYREVRQRHPDLGANQYDPHNSIRAAADYLCDSGARSGDLSSALYAYNHSWSYVSDVRAQANAYRSLPDGGDPR